MRTVLSNLTLETGVNADIAIENGIVVEIGKLGPGIDCSGLIALPGFVDLHTHLRQPGFEASETVLTGSKSGAAGGYTALLAMANTSPVADSAGVVEQVLELGVSAGYLQVQPIGAVTKGLEGKELAAIGSMANSRAKVRVFSDDGNCVHDPLLMQRALQYVKGFGGVIAQHAQEPRLTEGSQMNDGALATELGLKGWPAVAEEAIIARDALLAEQTGARLHICHLTTAGAVDVVRWAKARGIQITAEVTPHHLMLTEELVRGYDPIFKVNPPLRTTEDTLALRAAVLDGTVDVLGTDHAPHSIEKKDCEWESAAFGMVGLEHAASVLQEVILGGGGSWEQFAKVISRMPAKIAGLDGQGDLKIGSQANITLIDPSAKRTISSKTHSKSSNNPFKGMTLPGQVVHTLYKGKFTVKDSELQGND
jgi:dihydroorotase